MFLHYSILFLVLQSDFVKESTETMSKPNNETILFCHKG
jgi:hypothetical protein